MQSETTVISCELLNEIIRFLHIDLCSIKFVGYSQNFIYKIADESGEKILRITSDKHRTRSQISSELEWIEYLKANGILACSAIINTANGDEISSFETTTDILHCVLFEKARGIPIDISMLNDELYFLHGALVGKVHRLAHQCSGEITANRFNWQDNRLFNNDIHDFIPVGIKENIVDIAHQLIAEALELPITITTYGMIHFDLHYDNFFQHGNDLWIFDFDNCSNGYYINDIAKALWSSVFTYHRKSEYLNKSPFQEFTLTGKILERIWTPFWKGYSSENTIEDNWFEQLPLFFEIIHLKEFVHHYRHKVPYRNEELKYIFTIEQKQIEERIVPVAFNFKTCKAIYD